MNAPRIPLRPLSEMEMEAIRFAHLYRKKSLLKAKRNSCACSEETNGDESDGYYCVAACWKGEDEMCHGCKERCALHAQMAPTTAELGKSRRRLFRLIDKIDEQNPSTP